MAIVELNVPSVKTALTTDTNLSAENAATQGAKLGPILSGESLKVTSGAMSDLEKLVARLKNESEDAKMTVSQRRISILQSVLDSMNDRITEAQRNSILDIETLNSEKVAAQKELSGLTANKAASEGVIASLEKQIEQAVKDGEDHRELVAKLKEKLAAEQEKLDQINGAISSVSAKIAGIDVKIAKCTDAIGASTLSEVSAALRAAAGEVNVNTERSETAAHRRKAEEKLEATDIANSISKALDKIDEQIRQVLDEAQMKVEG